MKKDLHDIDDLFRSALNDYEEAPPAWIKEKLDATLKKNPNRSEKRNFTGWKKTLLFLVLLAAGFNLYELSLLKINSLHGFNSINSKILHQSATEKNNTIEINNLKDAVTHQEISAYEKNHAEKKQAQQITILQTDHHSIAHQKQWESTLFSNQNIIETNDKSVSARGTSYIQQNIPAKETADYLNEKNNIPKTPDVSAFLKTDAITDSLFKKSTGANTTKHKEQSFKSFWMITAYASYERVGYRLDSDIPDNITSIKHSEVHEPSFSLGILGTRQLKKHWGVQAGVVYNQTDIGITPQKLYALQDPAGHIAFKYVTSSGYAYIKPGLGAPPAIGDSLITTDGKHRLKSISIPLVLKYAATTGKLTITPGVGAEVSVVTSAKIETEVERPSSPEMVFINKLNGAKPFYISLVADAELRYAINKKLSLSLRPAIRVAISPAAKNNIVETFPKSIGTGISLTRKF